MNPTDYGCCDELENPIPEDAGELWNECLMYDTAHDNGFDVYFNGDVCELRLSGVEGCSPMHCATVDDVINYIRWYVEL